MKGDFGGLEGGERGWKEGTEKVGMASGKITMLLKRLAPDIGNGVNDAGLRFSSTCSLHAAALTTAGHPSLMPASLPSPDRHRHNRVGGKH